MPAVAIRRQGRRVERWAELRTAYAVARRGTVSGAAAELGVHRATVTRHIEALEDELGARMFHRHARGYALTEIGRELLAVAERAETLLSDFAGRTRARATEATGAITVTAMSELSELLAPAFAAFAADHPKATTTFVAATAQLKLERGEAQVAVRAGAKPTEPDYVVQSLPPLRFGLYASRAYLAERPALAESGFAGHRLIASDRARVRAPFMLWLERNAPPATIALRVADGHAARAALRAGLGVGFLSRPEAAVEPELVEVRPAPPSWRAPLWLLSHVDLHRTRLVQGMCAAIKGALAQQNPSDGER